MNRQLVLVVAAAAAISVSSFWYFYSRGMTNVYGDGIARSNIARKVVDSSESSMWRRYIQIGSPWLPLQTVLMLPLVASDKLWRSGAAGSIVSMAAFVATAAFLYLIAAGFYSKEPYPSPLPLPLVAVGVFLLNPTAIYLQSTALSEMVFLATLSAAVWLLQRWAASPANQSRGRLLLAGAAMSAATLSRYEAWPVVAVSLLVVTALAKGNWRSRLTQVTVFACVALSGPVYWIWHNWAIYGNPFEFLTGPNSARGLYLQNRMTLGWASIFVGNLPLDLALMLLTVAVCAGFVLVLLAAVSAGWLVVTRRTGWLGLWPLVLLGMPFCFDVFSIYRGEIQVFPLAAFGLLNVRYGVTSLLFLAMAVPSSILAFRRLPGGLSIMLPLALVAGQYGLLIAEGPSQLAVYQEGYRNGVNARPVRERSKVSVYLLEHPPRSYILMHTGSLGPVVTQGGLSFSEIIHEGTSRWHAIDREIPKDVRTIVLEKGDPLDLKLLAAQPLQADVDREFRKEFASGSISVFERIN
jgi:hypothetical protein